METGSAKKLKRALEDIRLVVDAPQWDLTVFCRFLAARVPDDGEVAATDLARNIEALIADLEKGVDSQTDGPFRTLLLNDRGDLIYNYFRTKLLEAAEALFNSDYSDELRLGLKLPAPAAPETEAQAAASGSEAAS